MYLFNCRILIKSNNVSPHSITLIRKKTIVSKCKGVCEGEICYTQNIEFSYAF